MLIVVVFTFVASALSTVFVSSVKLTEAAAPGKNNRWLVEGGRGGRRTRVVRHPIILNLWCCLLCHGAKGHQKYCECRVANKVNVGVASVDACRSLLHHYPNVWGVVRPRNAGTIDRFVHCHPLSSTLTRNCRRDFIFQLHWMESSSTRPVGVESRVGSDWPVHVSSGVSVAWGELGSYPLYFVVVFVVNYFLFSSNEQVKFWALNSKTTFPLLLGGI